MNRYCSVLSTTPFLSKPVTPARGDVGVNALSELPRDKLPSLRQSRKLCREPIDLGFDGGVFGSLVLVVQLRDLN